ncbi:MAG: aldo/keto reductase [Flavobacteriaceae bacterium]|jgi:predicted oxidoreductase|nr:aldo/keto reductase [Flavobacteriaceae bacterium]NVJ73166.1 aldo/keto reductase [Flavobacteriaceae bacterium]
MSKKVNFSSIISGTMTWGEWGKNYSTKEMASLIEHCVSIGVSTFDHADIYGDYSNEAEFGAAFKESGIERESIELISKCGISRVCDRRNYMVHHYNYTKEYIINSVKQSLQNLQTDYLDVLLLHRPSPLMNPYEISEAITYLKNKEMIRSFGVSNFTPSQLSMIDKQLKVEINQIEISLTKYDSMYNGQLDQCIEKKILPMSWSPLGTAMNKENPKLTMTLERLAKKYSLEVSQILIAWLVKHPAGIIPVVGTTQKDRISQALEASKVDLELEDWFDLLEATRGHQIE